MRNSLIDQLCMQADLALRTLFSKAQAHRPSPATEVTDFCLKPEEKLLAARLMRVNHSGEVCAQALYAGQSVSARLPETREQMEQAAKEETDHLAWCEERLAQLDSRPSLLNPLLYTGSWLIGAISGAVGDRWSLGFVAETERQVVNHLDSHLEKLPAADLRSQAVIKQMRIDEEEHRHLAIQSGAANFPMPVKALMNFTSKLMTKSVYWI